MRQGTLRVLRLFINVEKHEDFICIPPLEVVKGEQLGRCRSKELPGPGWLSKWLFLPADLGLCPALYAQYGSDTGPAVASALKEERELKSRSQQPHTCYFHPAFSPFLPESGPPDKVSERSACLCVFFDEKIQAVEWRDKQRPFLSHTMTPSPRVPCALLPCFLRRVCGRAWAQACAPLSFRDRLSRLVFMPEVVWLVKWSWVSERNVDAGPNRHEVPSATGGCPETEASSVGPLGCGGAFLYVSF